MFPLEEMYFIDTINEKTFMIQLPPPLEPVNLSNSLWLKHRNRRWVIPAWKN